MSYSIAYKEKDTILVYGPNKKGWYSVQTNKPRQANKLLNKNKEILEIDTKTVMFDENGVLHGGDTQLKKDIFLQMIGENMPTQRHLPRNITYKLYNRDPTRLDKDMRQTKKQLQELPTLKIYNKKTYTPKVDAILNDGRTHGVCDIFENKIEVVKYSSFKWSKNATAEKNFKELIRTINHEYMHFVLFKEAGLCAGKEYDTISVPMDYISIGEPIPDIDYWAYGVLPDNIKTIVTSNTLDGFCSGVIALAEYPGAKLVKGNPYNIEQQIKDLNLLDSSVLVLDIQLDKSRLPKNLQDKVFVISKASSTDKEAKIITNTCAERLAFWNYDWLCNNDNYIVRIADYDRRNNPILPKIKYTDYPFPSEKIRKDAHVLSKCLDYNKSDEWYQFLAEKIIEKLDTEDRTSLIESSYIKEYEKERETTKMTKEAPEKEEQVQLEDISMVSL